MENILAIHVETTGIDPKKDEIVSIALVACDSNFKVKDGILLYRSDVDDESVSRGYPYNKLDSKFLKKNGVRSDKFVESIAEFVINSFDLDKPIYLLGYNLANFSKPFFEELLGRFELTLEFSPNLLDAYPVAVTVLGKTTIVELVDLFCKDECLDQEKVMQKCIAFVNIFKGVRKLWNKKILNAS